MAFDVSRLRNIRDWLRKLLEALSDYDWEKKRYFDDNERSKNE